MMPNSSTPDRRHILVVDDDEDIRSTLHLILEEEGYGVSVSSSGRSALERLRDGALPDLILLDLMMPDMDGWAFLQSCGDDLEQRGIPVVVLTASTVGRLPPGAAAILRKPIQLDQLLGAIARYERKEDERYERKEDERYERKEDDEP